MYNGKSILVTGATGSFGTAFLRHLLSNYVPKKVVVFSRDEMKQWVLQQKFEGYESTLRFMTGDVRDLARLTLAFKGIDFVIHAAATKIVMTAEYDPFECIKTNVMGAMNVIEAAISNDVERVVALSTDKASSPINLYGASKLCSDKTFIAANNYSANGATRFSVVRYGNVLGSRGSVIPFFRRCRDHIPVTDARMTRFVISMNDAIELVNQAVGSMKGGELFIKKVPSIKVLDIAEAVNPNLPVNFTGIRPGEKLHEQMLSSDESNNAYDFGNHYRLFPSIKMWDKAEYDIEGGESVPDSFEYASDTNDSWWDANDLKRWLAINETDFLDI